MSFIPFLFYVNILLQILTHAEVPQRELSHVG